jgi:double-strand break repair protein MRE11
MSDDESSQEDSVLKVLIATDNHLGYQEKDPIRGGDSFAAFEEILKTGKEREVERESPPPHKSNDRIR